MTARIGLALAVLALWVGSGVWAYWRGHDAAMASVALDLAAAQRAAVAAADLASRKEQDRLALEASRAALERELEDAALADPVTAAACFPVGRVQRLNR